jgi:hypothetical protein
MTATEIQAIADDRIFSGVVNHYLIKTALAVFDESDATENHTERLAYAKQILRGQVNLGIWVRVVLANATISAKADRSAIADSEIEYVVTTAEFNKLAS